MRILICDDEEHFLLLLEDYIKDYMRNRYIKCSIRTTTNPTAVLNSKESYDLAFLDIQMPINGIELAKELKQRNSRIVLFFITNYEEFQDDAMDLRAFRFYEKPFDAERLYAGLDKAMEYIDGSYVDFYLYNNGSQQRVLVDDILYITRENRKVVMVTNKSIYNTRESFVEWMEKLPPLFFYQVHNSYFVNLHYVDKYDYKELIMSNGERIPIAPRKQSAFHSFWFEYLRRR